MPRYFKRTFGYRRRPLPRRFGAVVPRRKFASRTLARPSTAYRTASKALSMVRGLRKLINVEYKVHDVVETVGSSIPGFPANAWYSCLNVIPLGDQKDQRNGNLVLMKSLDLRFDIQHNSSGPVNQRVAFMLLNYPANAKETPNIGEVLDNPGIFRPRRNLDFTKSYRILAMRWLDLDKTNRVSAHVQIHRKLDFHAKYWQSTPDAQDLTAGMIYCYLWSDVSVNPPAFKNFTSRIRYIDN